VRLAAGFRLHRSGPRILAVAAPWEAAALALGLVERGGLERLLAGNVAGGARNAVVPLPGCRERLHLRPLRHGGWLAGVLGDRIAGPGRPLAELAVHAQLARAGVPVPRPALVAARRRMPGVWTAALGTVHEEDARNGIELLSAEPAREELLAAAAAAGRALRRFHDAGGRHPDLHVGNLLFRCDRAEQRAWIIDLDGARIVTRLPTARRMREIMRLHRSLVKRQLAAARAPAVTACFLDAYTAGDADLRRQLLRWLPREKLRLTLHQLGYRKRGRC
jgi:tRNA A-37 threonylcarbamoyl transferase component Bud32